MKRTFILCAALLCAAPCYAKTVVIHAKPGERFSVVVDASATERTTEALEQANIDEGPLPAAQDGLRVLEHDRTVILDREPATVRQ